MTIQAIDTSDASSFLAQTIVGAGKRAGELYSRHGVQCRIKSTIADVVTEADHAVNDILIGAIQAHFPSHGIRSEELEVPIQGDSKWVWILDPIDGSRNFARGIPYWSIFAALLHEEEPRIAAMYNPISNDQYMAVSGQGSTLNGEPLNVNACDSLDDALGMILCSQRGVAPAAFRRALDSFIDRSSWLQNLGCLMSAGHVASGAMDFVMANCCSDHDYVAPVLIAREAGALVTNRHGAPWRCGEKDIVIANPRLHPQLIALLAEEAKVRSPA